jgi:hypothetical protein
MEASGNVPEHPAEPRHQPGFEKGVETEPRLGRNVVAALHVYASASADPQQEVSWENGYLSIAGKMRQELEPMLRDKVTTHLGPEFSAEIEPIRQGSIEIIGLILLVGSLAGTYNTVREALLNLRADWDHAVSGYLQAAAPAGPVKTSSFLRLGPATKNLPIESTTAEVVRSPQAPRFPQVPRELLMIAAGALFLIFLGYLVVLLLLLAGVLPA